MIIHCFIDGQRISASERRHGIWCAGIWAVLIFLTGCRPEVPASNEVTVFAASSLQPAMEEVADAFRAEHGLHVQLNFAASGVLAEQILAGGIADIFLSANEHCVEQLVMQGVAVKNSVKRLMSNSMVIVAHESTDWKLDSVEDLDDIPFRYLVIGDPCFVPAGSYVRRFFQTVSVAADGASLWDSIEGRVCPTSDLRRVLALVESDRSVVGIVYATDALKSQGTRVIHHMDYPNARVDYFRVTVQERAAAMGNRDAVETFTTFLAGETSSKIFERLGFVLPEETK
jgi:molybdate transport system substrate-binding protein